jgi:hypothetical protein
MRGQMNRKILISLGAALMGVLALFGFLYEEPVKAEPFIIEVLETVKPGSLCQPAEQVIWTCTTTRNKIVSICGSRGLTAEKGYVQYRFGTSRKVELELPQGRTGSQSFFRYARYTRPLVTMLSLTFTNNDVTYEIHDDDNAEEKPPVRSASIDITSGTKTASITCRQPVSGSLMKLEDIVTRDENRF